MTIAHHVSRAKAVRLVTGGRLITCTFAAIAATLGFGTNRNGVLPVVIVGVWSVLALALFVDARRNTRPRMTPWILIVDVLVVALLLTMTGGLTSAYFPMIALPPFAANTLYGKRAAAGSMLAALAIYVAAALATHEATDPRFMVVRLGLLVLLGLAVLLRADYEQRVQEDMENLANWTRGVAADRESAVRELLARAARTLRAPRAAIAWREADGAAWFAEWTESRFELDEEPPAAVVVPELERASSFLNPPRGSGLRTADGAIGEFAGPFLAPRVAGRLAAQSTIGARFATQTVDGWLFFLDRKKVDADDLMLAEVVARLASAGLDQFNVAEVLREGAAANERIRLSRDLHDGLLQSLSGLALHAQVARRAVASDPLTAEERLETVVDQLAAGQRTLRAFVEELRPELTTRREPLPARLAYLAQTIAAQWDVDIDLRAGRDLDDVEPRLAGHVASLLAEAMTNAARHAEATLIRAHVRIDGEQLAIDVEDDGRGFPFHGRWELGQLVAERRGPWSLKERVLALGGQMVIDSSGKGSRVELQLPLTARK